MAECVLGRIGKQPASQFYRLTKAGQRQLKEETSQWTRISEAMATALQTP